MKHTKRFIRRGSFSLLVFLIILSVAATTAIGQEGFKVISVKGKAMLRMGLSEKWEPVKVNDVLKPADTILSGENCEIVLETPQNTQFVINKNTLLDLADVRPLTIYELLLFLTDKELDKIPYEENKETISETKIGVIHGDKKSFESSGINITNEDMTAYKLAGIEALLNNKYTESAIARFSVLTSRYEMKKEFLPVAFKTGKALEQLSLLGNARDIYEEITAKFPNDPAAKKAKAAIDALR